MTNRKWVLLIAAILVVSLAACAGILFLRPAGTQVVVTVNGAEYGTYDLHRNKTVVIAPEDGSWHNTLIISGGNAEITEADCDNQICVHTPALTEDTIGIIVCLPHGVVVELK